MPTFGTELPGLISPAATLHATHRNLDLALGREKDGRVEDAILLGPDEFFAFEEENPNIAAVLDQEIGNRAAFGQFLHRHRPGLESLVGEQVVYFGRGIR